MWKQATIATIVLGAALGAGGIILKQDGVNSGRIYLMDKNASRAERVAYLQSTSSTSPAYLAKKCWESGGVLQPGEKFKRVGSEAVTFRSVRCVFDDSSEIQFEKPSRNDDKFVIKAQ